MTKTARLYGGSLYDLAVEEGNADELMQQTEQIRQLFRENPEYLRLLAEPSLALDERKGLIDAAFGSADKYLCGQEAKVVCVFGAVDGFYPTRDAFEVVSTDEERETVLSNGRRAFTSAAAKANELLVVSYFSKANLELAEQTKMQVTRVKSEHGDRIALLRPSQFVREGEANLSTIGGQQLIAELDL